MKRKLISYDAFDRIEKNSLSNAAFELTEAEHLLSNLLETGPLSLHCYDQSNVVYEQADGTYIRADYTFNKGRIHFANIEQVVIDEASYENGMKSTISAMLEALLNNDEGKADLEFQRYTEMAAPKMKYMRGRKGKGAMDKMSCNMRGNLKEGEDIEVKDRDSIDNDKSVAAKKGHLNNPASRLKAKETRKKHKGQIDQKHKNPAWLSAKKEVDAAKKQGKKNARIKPNRYNDWTIVANNVLDYVDFQNNGPAVSESIVDRNHHDEITSITIPASQLRAEGKVLQYKYQGLKTDVKVLREEALALAAKQQFQRAVAEVKRYNNLSDNDGLEEAINNLVNNFPTVLYLTQEELTRTISHALEQAGVGNYDDQICNFMAEGILRVAYGAYPDRVNRITALANASIPESAEDSYTAFQDIVHAFYNTVDESCNLESKVFEDLYEVFTDIRREALDAGMDGVRNDASRYLESLEAVLSRAAKPTLRLAEQAAAYITLLVESNLESSAWNIVKQPYTTLVGEHPDMAKKAAMPYTPSRDFSGNWGDPAPALDDDGGSYRNGGAKKMRSNSWGNKGGKDTYPDLHNPIVPKAGDWTMKGDKGVDKDSDSGFAQWQSSDTFPGITNPYLPKSVQLHVNSDNRVDDVNAKL